MCPVDPGREMYPVVLRSTDKAGSRQNQSWEKGESRPQQKNNFHIRCPHRIRSPLERNIPHPDARRHRYNAVIADIAGSDKRWNRSSDKSAQSFVTSHLSPLTAFSLLAALAVSRSALSFLRSPD